MVKLSVPSENRARFGGLMGEVMPVFEDNDWRLIHHLTLDKSAASVGGSSSTHPDHYYHLWEIPDFDSLTGVMNLAADTQAYVELDGLVASEVQNVGVSAYYDPASATLPDTEGDFEFYLLEELDMVRDPAVVNEFAVAMNTTVIKMKTAFGWRLQHAMIGSTGQTNRWVHLWGVPKGDQDAAVRYYRESPEGWSEAYRRAVQTWRQSRWLPVTYGDYVPNSGDANG